MLTSRPHPITGHRTGERILQAYRSPRPKFWWTRIKLARACARTIGHCWHLEDHSWIDWYCCNCPALVDGEQPQDCVVCGRDPAPAY